MAKDTKFGLFGGVFTPSVLTILGVIMYLRLPWLVGQAGLWQSLGIIVVAHVVSIATGLSISSIATDKKVGAGGPYYIVSRSLGLPIGGTLGLALFLGLSFSISLYIIGFSESFLNISGIGSSPAAIRICGTITLLLLVVITFISTALAIKTQYIILLLIAVSLVAIFFGGFFGAGSPIPTEGVHTGPLDEAPSFGSLFGLFFPAVTGFTAGVNMSGDLRDPKRAIPSGTMLAISAGFVVYAGLAIFLAITVPAEVLIGTDPIAQAARADTGVDMTYDALIRIAVGGTFTVTAGIWGATLSSALGSILGAPRILQATASDSITPKIFAKGHGKANEPRNALILAASIGWAGVMIAELDAIAAIVSMVFLTTYGFLNMSAAIESWVSPDFRPSFRIPRFVSIIGATACILLMIQLDLLAMAGATLVMGGLYAYLARRQLRLESGDAWEGIWSNLVRTGLYRLQQSHKQQRNWRPNILVFLRHGKDQRDKIRALASVLIADNGMATEFDVFPPGAGEEDEDEIPDEVGYFYREIESEDFYGATSAITQHHGFGGLEPNTVLLDWSAWEEDPSRFGDLLRRVVDRDYNLLLFAPDPDVARPDTGRQIDVWWRPGAGNLPLCISLVRFVTQSPGYRNANIRFLLLADEHTSGDYLRSETHRILEDRRVNASVRVVHSTSGEDDFDERVRAESAESHLVILGLREPKLRRKGGRVMMDEAFLDRLDKLARDVGDVLFFRAESGFEPILRAGRAGEPTQPVDAPSVVDDVQPLNLPAPVGLSEAARLYSDHHDQLASELDTRGLTPLYERNIELLKELRALLDKHFDTLGKRLAKEHEGKHENVVNRVQSAFLMDAEKLLSDFEAEGLVDQRGRLEARIVAYVKDGLYRPKLNVVVKRSKADFAPSPSDSPHLRAFKRRRRIVGAASRNYSYKIHIEPLVRYYHAVTAEQVLETCLDTFGTDSHSLAVQVGKLINSGKTSLTLLGGQFDGETSRQQFVNKQREIALGQVDSLTKDVERRRDRVRHLLFERTRAVSQRFANDIDRLDFSRFQKKERRLGPDAREALARVEGASDQWYEAQQLLIGRAKLGLLVSTFQHRLATIVHRTRETVGSELKGGVLSTLQELLASLVKWKQGNKTDKAGLKLTVDLEQRFDPKPIVDKVVRETTTLASSLPERTTTLSDESIRELTLGQCEELETRKVSARGVAELLLETEFISHVQRELEAVVALEERAANTARDVIRLLTFNVVEADTLDRAGFREHMSSVVDSAIERLQVEVEDLRAVAPRLDLALLERLTIVIDGTDAYELTRSSDNLTREFRKVEGKKAIRGLRGRVATWATRLRELMVYLLYRRSVGVLYARRLQAQAATRGPTVDRLTSFVTSLRPEPEILSLLPFFYRQLFLGQSSVNKSFWVERPAEMKRGRDAIARHKAGAHGAIVVTGERFAGKTAFLHRLVQQGLSQRDIFWVHSLPGGSASPKDFVRAVREATRKEGELDAILSDLPDGAVVVLDDLELWWERTDGGLAVLDRIFASVERHGGRLLFVLGVGTAAFRLIDRLRPFGDKAITVIDCGPMSAENLKHIVELRHGTAGMRFELGERDENELSQWALARLFSRHFDFAGGCVGSALRAWVANIRKVRDKTLVIEAPEAEHWEVVDELRVEWKALLLQLALHKRLTREALGRVTGLERDALDRDIGALARAGIVVEDRDGVCEIDPYLHHAVTDRFVRGGLLL